MYIKKYWGNFIGGSDDSLNLVGFFSSYGSDRSEPKVPVRRGTEGVYRLYELSISGILAPPD